MQEMLDTVYDYSSDHRFLIHPVKSNTVIKGASKHRSENTQQSIENFTLGDTTMEFKSETTHLGLKRTVTEESRVNIQERISLARRTLYSLIKTGVHGTNGLNARTSCKIYQVYVIPRLLYGLETIHLQNRDISELCSFHLSTLKQIQSLPNRTATSAVYLLLGVLPITAAKFVNSKMTINAIIGRKMLIAIIGDYRAMFWDSSGYMIKMREMV